MEQEESEDAWYSELITTAPVDMPVKSEDDAATGGTEASPDGEGLSVAMPEGLHRRELYCLLVRVAYNVDSVSALDQKVPNYVWNEVITRDICTYRVGVLAGTFNIELLSDIEFLLFPGPQSGPGMTWENTIPYIRILPDCHGWGGTEVTMVAGQRTMKQSKIDLANMRDYHQAHILGRLAGIEGRAQNLAIENTKTLVPQARGRDYTRRADCYFAQKAVGTPAPEPTLHALRPASPVNYHSVREPSEVDYENEESLGSGTDSTGYSSTTTATSHYNIDHTQHSNTKNGDQKHWNQKHRDQREGRKTNAKKQKDWWGSTTTLPGDYQGRSIDIR